MADRNRFIVDDADAWRRIRTPTVEPLEYAGVPATNNSQDALERIEAEARNA